MSDLHPRARALETTTPAMADLPAPPANLVHLAPELLGLVLSFLAPRDLASFARTCHRAQEFVRPNNQVLWKSAFLQLFDHPKHVWESLTPTARHANRPRESAWDWYRELRRRCTAFNAVRRPGTALLTNVEKVVTALLDVQETASITNTDDHGQPISLNLAFLKRLQQLAPQFDDIVHDYHRGIDSTAALPLDFVLDSDRPITRSMLGRGMRIPEWASRFHVSPATSLVDVSVNM